MTLKMKNATFDKSVRIWFELYFVLAVVGTILINRLPLLLDERNPLYLFFWFVMLIIGCLKAIKVKLVVDSEYKAVEIVETRRGVNLYLKNYWQPIYVPFKWLNIRQDDEKNNFILNYDRAIQFERGKALLLSGSSVVFSEKYFVFEEMSELFDVIEKLKKDPNTIINYSQLNLAEKDIAAHKWQTAKIFPWLVLGASLPIVILTSIISDNFFAPSVYTPEMAASINAPDYHKIYKYSKGMTISTNFYKFTILHAYEVQQVDSGDDYIVLNIRAKASSNYPSIGANNFMSFDNWSINAEKEGDSIDDATNNKNFIIKYHGKKKSIIDNIRSGWDSDEGGDVHIFNVVLAKAPKQTDVVYAGFDASLSKSKNQDTSFVLKVQPEDLEKL